jgi:hypothetical protein
LVAALEFVVVRSAEVVVVEPSVAESTVVVESKPHLQLEEHAVVDVEPVAGLQPTSVQDYSSARDGLVSPAHTV